MAIAEADAASVGGESTSSAVEPAAKRLKSAENEPVIANNGDNPGPPAGPSDTAPPPGLAACVNDTDAPQIDPLPLGENESVVLANDGEAVIANRDDTEPPATLSTMPQEVLVSILRLVGIGYDILPSCLALEATCTSLRDAMGMDEIWRELFPLFQLECENSTTKRETLFITKVLRNVRKYQKSTENLLLDVLGGADGVRRVVAELLARMRPDVGIIGQEDKFKAVLRGDSVAYLVAVIESHVVTRLSKAHNIAIHKAQSPGAAYPQITSTTLQLLDALLGEDESPWVCSVARGSHGNCIAKSFGYEWPADNCGEDDVLGAAERTKIVRLLAYRAGVVKLSGEAFSIVAAEILHFMGSIVAHAFEACKGMHSPLEKRDSDPRFVHLVEEARYGNYYTNYQPPFQEDEDGKVECVIVPRQIEEAAVKLGMRKVLGFNDDFDHWAASSEDLLDEERDEARGRYFKESVEPGKDPMGSNAAQKAEAAAASGDYKKAGFIQAEEKMSTQVDAAINFLKNQMKAAAAIENYILAGVLQDIANRLEGSRQSLHALERDMFEAAVRQDFVKAGQLQEQHRAILQSMPRLKLICPVTVVPPMVSFLLTQS
ncbi:hypothetical protein ACHAXT_005151 [Thalassiosira profunda]